MSTMVEPHVAVALEPWRAKQFGLDAAAFYFQGFASGIRRRSLIQH
jgi:hypothetical protein